MNWYYNLSVKLKLMLFTGLIVLLTFIIAFSGYLGILDINNMDKQLYEENTTSIVAISSIIENVLHASTDFDMSFFTESAAELAGYKMDVEQLNVKLQQTIDEFKNMPLTFLNKEEFNKAADIYTNYFAPNSKKIFSLLESGKRLEAEAVMKEVDEKIDEMVAIFNATKTTAITEAQLKRAENEDSTAKIITIQAIIFLITVLIAAASGYFITRSISRPLKLITKVSKQIGNTGDLMLSDDLYKKIKDLSVYKDEFGESTKAFSEMLHMFRRKTELLATIAEGDFTVDIELMSENDTMGQSMKKMIADLRSLFSDVIMAANQISVASSQITKGSQLLAEGSAEQATSMEQLTASIDAMSKNIQENAQMSQKAADFGETIKHKAENGSVQMEELLKSVKEIDNANRAIDKVLDMITNIAFQTGILALNASVEAARAGTHGRGFSVVANEVRNLSNASTDAAKDTGGLIDDSISKAIMGVHLAGETSLSFIEIASNVASSSKIISDIAKSTSEQALTVDDVKQGINQILIVVHQNASAATEFAATSEDLFRQSKNFLDMINKFKV